MNGTNKLASAENVWELASSFQKSRIFLTAYELKVFTALSDKSKTAPKAALRLRVNPRALERLMNALCAMELLEKKKGRYSNTPLTLRFLVEGKPEFIAGLMHAAHLWDNWSSLTQSVRKGTSALGCNVNVHKRNREWLNAFIACMHERAYRQAAKVVSMLNLSGVSRILDVGAGSGAYAMAFVRAKEGLRATAFDLPSVVSLTRNYIKREGLLNKVTIIAGDYNVDTLGSGFDLVFLSAVVHSNSFAKSRKLIAQCAKALNPGGQVVVQDFIMNEDRVQPAFGAFFALNMLVATEDGDAYTESEVKSWMKDAGLSRSIRKDTKFDTSLIIGRKSKK